MPSTSALSRTAENVTTLSTILKVCEVLGAVAGEMIREETAARRLPKDTGT
jgi:hypothetical protein